MKNIKVEKEISSQDLKKRLIEIRMAQKKKMDLTPSEYYVPNRVIEEFIDLVADKEFFIVFISAANGVGKSTVGANILANFMFPSENKFFQHDFFQNFPFKKQGRIVTDSALVDKNIVQSLKEWFPKDRFKTSKGNKHFESQWETDTGHKFDIMTYDQQPKEFEGVTLGWAWLDEPPPDAILKAIISRMRTGGKIFITATPLAGSGYLFDMFVEGANTSSYELPDGTIRTIERKVAHVTADMFSACKDCEGEDGRGHLLQADIENIIAEYDEDERQARVYGKFQHLVGRVFKKFDNDIHVIKPFNVNHNDYEVWNMLDPHPRNPDAILWVAVDKYGSYYVIDEIYSTFDNVEQMAAMIKSKDAQYRVTNWIADPSAWAANQHDELQIETLADRLASFGVHYQKATKARTMADQSIRDALNYVQVGGKMMNPPRLYFFENVERTLWEMPRYVWQEHTGRSADRKDRSEKPKDKDDHMIECLGRFTIQNPIFHPNIIENRIYEDDINDDEFDVYG